MYKAQGTRYKAQGTRSEGNKANYNIIIIILNPDPCALCLRAFPLHLPILKDSTTDCYGGTARNFL